MDEIKWIIGAPSIHVSLSKPHTIKYLGINLNNFAAGFMNRYRSQNSIARMVQWCETEKRWKEQLQASKEERALTRPTITIKSNETIQKRI